jgi:hypothetical protein
MFYQGPMVLRPLKMKIFCYCLVSLLSISISTAPLAYGQTPVSVKVGWKVDEADGLFCYIAQVTPADAMVIASTGAELAAPVPDFLQGRVQKVMWRIGISDVEREPSEEELRASFRSNSLRNGFSGIGSGNLTTMSERTGQTVPIDPQRVTNVPLPASSTKSLSDSEITPPPAFAQNFPSATTRMASNSGFDASSRPGFTPPPMSTNTTPVMPSSTYNNGSSTYGNGTLDSGFVGPPLPPGYTGGSVTVKGSPQPTYGSNNSLPTSTYAAGSNYANGGFNNFGTPSNLGSNYNSASNFPSLNPNSNYSYPSGNQFSTNGFGTTPTMSNGNFGQSNGMPYGNPAYRPDALTASNNFPNNGGFSGQSNYPNNGLGPNGMMQIPNNGFGNVPNGNFTSTGMNTGGSNFGGFNQGLGGNMPSPGLNNNFPSLASNVGLGPAPVGTRNPIDSSKPTMGGDDNYRDRTIYPPSSSNFMVGILLLVSFVLNIYLLFQLANFLQRYRTLLAANRGTSFS